MKKPITLLLLFLLFSRLAIAQALLPYPNQCSVPDGETYVLKGDVALAPSPELSNEASALAQVLNERCGLSVVKTSKNKVTLSVDRELEAKGGTEHYILDITQKGMSLTGASAAAVYRGIQTLDQWLLTGMKALSGGVQIACVHIDDAPRYGYRALMLDPARHFLPLNDIKRYVDEMARYKFNVLQLHLTDDQGWRLQILSHPELTTDQCYTQEEMRELQAYAAKKHIQIVPELDFPGHTYAVLKAHPELRCDHVDTGDWDTALHTDVMLCAGKDEVFTLYQEILQEVGQLFTSPYIHLGGDESNIARNWDKCPSCAARMKQLGIDSSQLMGWFFGHFWDQLHALHKTPILWLEMDNIYPPATQYLFPYPKDVLLVTWRNGLTPKALELTHAAGNELLMAPGEHCYFDYPQYPGDLPETNNWGMPITTLQQAYDWSPGYEELNLPNQQVKGVMGTLWGEAIETIDRAFYMSYPRSLALAEAGWTQAEHRDWKSFIQRLTPVLSDMMQRGTPYRVPFEAYQKGKATQK